MISFCFFGSEEREREREREVLPFVIILHLGICKLGIHYS